MKSRIMQLSMMVFIASQSMNSQAQVSSSNEGDTPLFLPAMIVGDKILPAMIIGGDSVNDSSNTDAPENVDSEVFPIVDPTLGQCSIDPQSEILIPSNAIYVSNANELKSTLESVSGGVFIVLRDGDYGEIEIREEFSSQIMIRAENPWSATFDEIDANLSKNLKFDGVDVIGEVAAEQSDNFEIINSRMGSAVFKSAVNTHFENNQSRYLNFNSASYFNAIGNFIHNASADLVHLKGGAHHFLFENNCLYDTIPSEDAHSDAIQLTCNDSGAPSFFTLRGNYVYDDPTTAQEGVGGFKKMQGFFFGGGACAVPYNNILIENNLMNISNAANSIFVAQAGNNITIRNNSLLPTSLGTGGGVRVSSSEDALDIYPIENLCITRNISDTSRIGSNHQVIDEVDNIHLDEVDADTLFQNPNVFGTWRMFLPKPGSYADFNSRYGAGSRVYELLNGTSLEQDQFECTCDCYLTKDPHLL